MRRALLSGGTAVLLLAFVKLLVHLRDPRLPFEAAWPRFKHYD